MLKKIMLIALAIVSFGTLTGCASIVSGTNQNVTVSTGHVGGANCTLENGKGQWQVYTPSTVYVSRSVHDLRVHCSKPGYHSSYKRVVSNARPLVLGNAVFGGPLGAGIDLVDGAAFRYPETIDVPMYRA